MNLSAVVIARNEEVAIGACLDALAWCQEIVVVDSGSIDRTREVARARGARVMDHEWSGYGPQKNFAVNQAANDWVLCVDADEIVSPELRVGIEHAFASVQFQAYEITRRNRFMGSWLRHGEGYPDRIVRLFDRRSAQWSEDPVHEKVMTGVPVGRIQGDLLHESAESLDSYLRKQNEYTTVQAEELYRRGVRPSVLRLVLSPLVRFIKFYLFRGGFLDGIPGLVHISIGCMNTFAKNAKLFALWRRQSAR
ncbi:MAG TPA: glycosyltransferase family 2 protein [Burkholderiales bacterium]|nr:glycosyltransferase family 2 protein [Burkholderiales bacterium]